MSHLLAISVGPVQEFIAAARRTRDLWFGSYLLSEISREVAVEVAKHGTLIFPKSTNAENVANVILAELPTGDPKAVRDKAREAAQTRWLKFADEAHREASGVIRRDIWDDQVKDVIEFYAAWVRQTGNYQTDRGKLMRLLAGRKNCRDFRPASGIDAGLPKSSLDGQRATVLHKRKKFPSHLRIREGEQLDVVGLVKRVAGGTQPYPSVSRVAADPWVRGNRQKPAFDQLVTACEELPGRVLHRLDKQAFPQFQDFPFEGTAVYVSRHHEWEEEIDEEDRLSISDIQEALSELPQPLPYLAVLVADGDKMGAAISHLPDDETNRQFSQALAGFANSARTIVNEHHGVLVYAGGDDVLAFLPVDKCLECSRKLHDEFGKLLKGYKFKDKLTDKEVSPTLSVGIAIGHFMENLEDLLEYGRAAEKAAKAVDGKDALAVHLHKRGGAPIKIASRWQDESDQRLTLYAELMQKEALPSKLPYDLHKLIELYEGPGWRDEVRREAMQRDALRVIADKQPRAGRAYMPLVRKIVANLDCVKKLRQFCDELLVARLLAEVFDQARREPTELPQRREEVAG
jgi:CRISPR-associated protein Cmr2